MIGWPTRAIASAFSLFAAGVHGGEALAIVDVRYHQQGANPEPTAIAGMAGPRLEMRVRSGHDIRPSDLVAKAYFYDGSRRLMEATAAVETSKRGAGRMMAPTILGGSKIQSLYLPVPDRVRVAQNWSAVLLFGNRGELCAEVFGTSSSSLDRDWRRYEFPEKKQVGRAVGSEGSAGPAMASVVEEVVRTNNDTQPQITLFLRPPKGVTLGSEVKGVLAMCVLANSVEEIRGSLLRGDQSLMRFADDNALAIIAWGSRRAWELAGSYHQFDRRQNRHVDTEFDKVAASWERGVKRLVAQYAIPDHDYLLWAASGAANWAHRLALRKPQYFAAAHIEILSTHDQPTQEAGALMWLMTTGELEGGYESSLRFFRDCRALGYPMIYKAYPGVGHASCAEAQRLGTEFFRFALQRIREADARVGTAPGDVRERRNQPFAAPPFYGDIVNQERFPAVQAESIPEAFRTPLPNKAIAEAWLR